MVDFSEMGGFPTTLISDIIALEPSSSALNITACAIKINFTGYIQIEITSNYDNASPTWETIVPTSGVTINQTFSVPGKSVKYIITGDSGSIISNTYNTVGKITAPGISIGLTYT